MGGLLPSLWHLESSTEGWLTPEEFMQLTQAEFSGGEFILWKSEAAKTAREIESKNYSRGRM